MEGYIPPKQPLTCDDMAQEVAERISEYKQLGTANCANIKETANFINTLALPKCADYNTDAKVFANDLANLNEIIELNCISKCASCFEGMLFSDIPREPDKICLCPSMMVTAKPRRRYRRK